MATIDWSGQCTETCHGQATLELITGTGNGSLPGSAQLVSLHYQDSVVNLELAPVFNSAGSQQYSLPAVSGQGSGIITFSPDLFLSFGSWQISTHLDGVVTTIPNYAARGEQGTWTMTTAGEPATVLLVGTVLLGLFLLDRMRALVYR